MPRGGRRTGTPGASYGNRTDLNATRALPPTAAKGQQYGAAGAQLAAQRQMPMGPPPTAMPPAGPPPAARPPAPAGPMPGQLTPLDAPTMRPGEPVTAGLSIGAGPGAEANPFNNVGSDDDAVLMIRAAYAAYPSEDLRQILERLDQ